MSNSIVRQALELFDDDVSEQPLDPLPTKSKSSSTRTNLSCGSKRKIAKKHQCPVNGVQKSHIKDKSRIEEYRASLLTDHTEKNVSALQRLTEAGKIDGDLTAKILEQHRGALAKDQPEPKKKKQEKTLFTDSDFEKFKKDYFST